MKPGKLPVPEPLIRTVHCLLCGYPATLKPTKTFHTMLRCDNCGVVIFANQELSDRKIRMLKNVQYNNNYNNPYPS